MLFVSTSWRGRDELLRDWFFKVKDCGFRGVELDYNFTLEQLDEIEGLLKESGLSVSSIHNFCPLPNDGHSLRHPSNYYRLSSVDEQERSLAVKWTKESVNTALRFGADVVVIHAGTLDFEDERSPELFALYEKGLKDTSEFIVERERILNLRTQRKQPYLEALEKSLGELMGYAQSKGIRIGLETRYYPIEIPSFEEIGYFLNLFSPQGLGYWHDVGHAQMNDELGLFSHQEILETCKAHLIGVHIHDIKGRRDHLAPGEGDFDFRKLTPYLNDSTLKVIEVKSSVSLEAMRKGIQNIEK